MKNKFKGQSQSGGHGPEGGKKDDKDKKKKYEPPIPTRVGKKKRKSKGPDAASKLLLVTPHTQCRLKLLKQERIKDYLLMEEEFIRNQEQMKPLEEKQEEERSKVDDLRGTPMSVGTLEEIIDDNHAIVSTSVGSEHYVFFSLSPSGRIDRKIEFPLPDEKTKRRIFQIHTSRITVAEDISLDDLILAKDDLSGADIKAICTEAGLMALSERRMKITNEDFKKSKENVLYKKQEGTPEGLYL
uniref:26S protease regulatory subunit 4-like n=1 Tax=Sinocyclocheilus rhinocerous TaxID=307959 RepID=A0A673MV04_9TELE